MKNNEFTVEKIRSKYSQQAHTELDALVALDAKVKKPATVFGYTYGSMGAIIMGSGMSLVMTDIASTIGFTGDPMTTGIIIGVIGMTLAIINYPIHNAILHCRKEKYGPEILALSEKIMNK